MLCEFVFSLGRKIGMCGIVWCALLGALSAQTKPPDTPSGTESPAHAYFSDVVLLDQNGKPHRLYSDLLEGKVVIINSFFTTCKDSCPVMNRNFAAIQQELKDRIGKNVFLLSLSVDPENDTPERLRAYAEHMKAGPGWLFLTGSKTNVDYALYKLGLYTQERQNHLTLFIVGNEPTGLWKKVQGTAAPEDLMHVVESVLEDRQ